jgi:hypothetical protein
MQLTTVRGGSYKVVEGLPVSPFARGKLEATEKELLEVRGRRDAVLA